MIADSHCHLNLLGHEDKEGGINIRQIIQDAEKKCVKKLISVSTKLEEVIDIKQISLMYDQVHYSVGVHPNEIDGTQPFDPGILIEQSKDERCVAIGETGLDYHNANHCPKIKRAQQKKFEIHIEAAQQLKKPLIIHTRKAKEDTLSILKNMNLTKSLGVIHCFSEDWDMAKRAIDMGLYISFSGIVTFKNAQSVREVAKKVPLDRLLIETDSPYLAPVPYRGTSNYPKYVYDIARFLSTLRNESFSSFCKRTYKNTCSLFQLT